MITVTEDYVSFETAKLLKEKGFDEPCECFYDTENNDPSIVNGWMVISNSELEKREFVCYSAPTLQKAMKWLREVHNLHISIEMGFDVDNRQYFFFVPSVCKFSNKTGEYQTPFGEKEFDTYEEATEAAIKYCLENLI